MKNLTVTVSPHITQKSKTTRSIMFDVLIALSPALVMAIVYFGYHVLINAIVCMGCCFAFELLYTLILKKDFSRKAVKESSCWDCSSLVTGLILALNLPRVIIVEGWNLNVYRAMPAGARAVDYVAFGGDTIILCLIGSLVAVVLVKMLFGGIGKNFANPAATARIFLFLAFGMTWANTTGLGEMLPASTGATWLSSGTKLTNNQNMFFQMFIGNRGAAAAGETCMIALILGYLYLSIRKVIDFRLPLIIVGSAAVLALLFDGLPRHLTGARLVNNMYAHIMSGGLVFGAIFMATDYATSPNTFWGSALYGFGIALFTMLIRVFANYPEGMSFAILIMNITVPLIDKYIVPRPFGYHKKIKEKPLKTPDSPLPYNEAGKGGAEA
ncbi:MAG: RnfABCDGE type electron transport complex subunit D [Clostridia bacterium]|nr:RnfABCDGE type electron transport complex subunit D [Clostridia bacterium]